MKCFYCDKEILTSEEKIMIAFDKPYANIFIHRNGCLYSVNEVGEDEYMNTHIERLYEFATRLPDATTKNKNIKRK